MINNGQPNDAAFRGKALDCYFVYKYVDGWWVYAQIMIKNGYYLGTRYGRGFVDDFGNFVQNTELKKRVIDE